MASKRYRTLDERELSRRKPSLWEHRGLGSCFHHARLRRVRLEGIMQVTLGWRGRKGAHTYRSTFTEKGIAKGLL